jgi:iron(III) transport system ATP-binding protein
VPKRKAVEMAAEKLRLVGLTGLEQRAPSELSGGQQQRVAVARALVLEPQVLLFDEPLSNLDAKLRRRVREEIRELQQSLSLTVAYVTHDQQEALAVSDRIIVMSDARIAQSGTPRELYEQPADRFVADFIGDANLVTGTLVEARPLSATIRVDFLQLEIPHRGGVPGRVTLAIRPEAIRIWDQRPQGAAMAGRVRKAAYLGAHVEYRVESPVGDLFAIDPSGSRMLAPGTTVWITLAQRGVALVPG